MQDAGDRSGRADAEPRDFIDLYLTEMLKQEEKEGATASSFHRIFNFDSIQFARHFIIFIFFCSGAADWCDRRPFHRRSRDHQ